MVNVWWLSSTAHAHTLERQCPGEFIPKTFVVLFIFLCTLLNVSAPVNSFQRPLNLRSVLCACSVVVEERQARPRVDEMLIAHAWMVYVVA